MQGSVAQRHASALREKPTARAPAYSAESALLLAARAVPSAEKKPTARAPASSAESALLLAARAVPSAPPLSTTAVAAVLKKRSHASILSFCTSFSQLSRYGLATPSSHDGCCAGTAICMQTVLRTLCFTKVYPPSPKKRCHESDFWVFSTVQSVVRSALDLKVKPRIFILSSASKKSSEWTAASSSGMHPPKARAMWPC